MTPLLWASWFGHVDVLQQLVNQGANVHATNLVRYVMSLAVNSVFCFCDGFLSLIDK